MTTDALSVLFNPSAGQGRARDLRGRVESRLRESGVPFELFVTGSEDELKSLAREHGRKYRTVAGAGGDSTFHIVANELLVSGATARLGMIGVGSSNDIDREFGLDSLDKACAALRAGRARRIDVGRIVRAGRTLRYFLGQANVGVGAMVNAYVAGLSGRRPGLARHQTAAGVLGVLRAYRSGRIPLALDIAGGGANVQGRFILGVFGNTRYWATGRMIVPDARPDDGILDACLISACPFRRLARIAVLASRGAHGRMKEVSFLRGEGFEVSAAVPFEVQTDGEILGGAGRPETFEKIRFDVLPGALDIIA
jgi:diacylglycerol kinase (ATP)